MPLETPGTKFPGAGVTDCCEPPDMGVENQTRVLCKNTLLLATFYIEVECLSYAQNWPSSPSHSENTLSPYLIC